MQRKWDLPPEVAKSRLYQGCLERPFSKGKIATHKGGVDLHEHIRVEFPHPSKKFCQSVLCDSARRLATTDPAEPDPQIMKSYWVFRFDLSFL
jgi:hypothetical protein